MNETHPTLSILLPVRNEGVNLKIMLKILKTVVECTHEVLVIHDDPQDDSVSVVNALSAKYPGLRVVHNKSGRGVIHALKTGVRVARGKYILIFAADEVGPVLAIDDMLELMENGCDMVSCTRYAHGGRRLGGSFIGKNLSRIANFLFHKISGSVLTDCTTGIKMFRPSLFNALELTSQPIGWVIAFEMAIKTQIGGFTLGEVPITSIDRLYGGQSTFRLGPWLVEYWRWFVWGHRMLRKIPPERRMSPIVRISTYFGGSTKGRENEDVSDNRRNRVHWRRHH